MKRFIEGAGRDQATSLPDCREDWVEEDNPVRAIDAFIDALDLGDLGFCRRRSEGDRPPIVSSDRAAEAVRLRLSQSCAVQPAFRA